MTEEFDFEKHETEISEDVETPPMVFDQDMLRRRMVWYMAPCAIANEVVDALGLPPASDDVENQEHLDSHMRQRIITYHLGLLLNQFSLYAAEVTRATFTHKFGEEALDNPFLALPNLHNLFLQSTMSILAELADIGAVHIHQPLSVDVASTPDEGGLDE